MLYFWIISRNEVLQMFGAAVTSILFFLGYNKK